VTSGPYGEAEYPSGYPPTGGQPDPTARGSYPGDSGYQAVPPGTPYQPPPGPPYQPPPGYGYPAGYGYPQPRNGMGTAGLVLGIIGLVFCWALWIGWILNALAIIFGGVGVSRANQGAATNKGAAQAGLILGIVGLVLGLALWATLGTFWHSVLGHW